MTETIVAIGLGIGLGLLAVAGYIWTRKDNESGDL